MVGSKATSTGRRPILPLAVTHGVYTPFHERVRAHMRCTDAGSPDSACSCLQLRVYVAFVAPGRRRGGGGRHLVVACGLCVHARIAFVRPVCARADRVHVRAGRFVRLWSWCSGVGALPAEGDSDVFLL